MDKNAIKKYAVWARKELILSLIHISYLITPADEEREFGNLERLHDNYPKYVISCLLYTSRCV